MPNLTVYLSEEQKRLAEQIAGRVGISVQRLMRGLLVTAINRQYDAAGDPNPEAIKEKIAFLDREIQELKARHTV